MDSPRSERNVGLLDHDSPAEPVVATEGSLSSDGEQVAVESADPDVRRAVAGTLEREPAADDVVEP